MRRISGSPLQYQAGFAHDFVMETIPGTLPLNVSRLERAPSGLHAEELTSAHEPGAVPYCRRSWLYRMRPSAVHRPFRRSDNGRIVSSFIGPEATPPAMTWAPLERPAEPTDFLDGLVTVAGVGGARDRAGSALHLFACNRDMCGRFFFNADGELLIGLHHGRLLLRTELGNIALNGSEFAVVPRGVRFQVTLPDGVAQGYVWENFQSPLGLPEACVPPRQGAPDAKHFFTPHAACDCTQGDFTVMAKYEGDIWAAPIGRSPFDVVAWRGNCTPYKYDRGVVAPTTWTGEARLDPSNYLLMHTPGGPDSTGQNLLLVPAALSPEKAVLASRLEELGSETGSRYVMVLGKYLITVGLIALSQRSDRPVPHG